MNSCVYSLKGNANKEIIKKSIKLVKFDKKKKQGII